MEDRWFLSTPMPLNAHMVTLETKEKKTQRESYIVIDEMTNALEQFGKKNRTTKRRQLQQNQPTGSLLDGSLNIIFTRQSQHIPKKKK